MGSPLHIRNAKQINPFGQSSRMNFIGTFLSLNQLSKGIIYPYFGGFYTFDHHLVNYRIGVNN